LGTPRAIAAIDQKSLVELARRCDALIELDCAVGDPIVYDIKLLQVRGASLQLPETELLRAFPPRRRTYFRTGSQISYSIAGRHCYQGAIGVPTTGKNFLQDVYAATMSFAPHRRGIVA
jgi:hypothetical protein